MITENSVRDYEIKNKNKNKNVNSIPNYEDSLA